MNNFFINFLADIAMNLVTLVWVCDCFCGVSKIEVRGQVKFQTLVL